MTPMFKLERENLMRILSQLIDLSADILARIEFWRLDPKSFTTNARQGLSERREKDECVLLRAEAYTVTKATCI